MREAKIKHINRARQYVKHNRHKRLISVVVYVNTVNQAVSECLESIRKNTQRSYEIILIDDTQSSEKALKVIADRFIKKYPKTKLHTLRRKKKTSSSAAINAGIKKFARGEIVLVIGGTYALDPDTLKNLSRQFTNKQLAIVNANIQTPFYPSLPALCDLYGQFIAAIPRKLFSTAGLPLHKSVSGYAYRRNTNLSRLYAKCIVKYADDVMLYRAPLKSWKSLFTRIVSSWLIESNHTLAHRTQKNRLTLKQYFSKIAHYFFRAICIALVITTPLVMSYLLYLAVYFKQTALFGLSWAIFTIVIMGVVMKINYLKLPHKILLVAVVPATYYMFYLNCIVQSGLLVYRIVKQRLTFVKI